MYFSRYFYQNVFLYYLGNNSITSNSHFLFGLPGFYTRTNDNGVSYSNEKFN